MKTPQTVDAKIMAIRASFGAEKDCCPTCTRAPDAPFRVYNERGRVELGCVDAIHGGRLIGESSRWHARPEAKGMRRAELRRLQALRAAS